LVKKSPWQTRFGSLAGSASVAGPSDGPGAVLAFGGYSSHNARLWFAGSPTAMLLKGS
jgi:hypothetical protein